MAVSLPPPETLARWNRAAIDWLAEFRADARNELPPQGSRAAVFNLLRELEGWTDGAMLEQPPAEDSRSDAARSPRRASPGLMDPNPAVRRHTPPEG